VYAIAGLSCAVDLLILSHFATIHPSLWGSKTAQRFFRLDRRMQWLSLQSWCILNLFAAFYCTGSAGFLQRN
jgi:hypothetical protein